MKIGLALLALFASTLPFAAIAGNLCQDAGIHYLQVIGIDGWGWDDHCKRSPNQHHQDWPVLVKKIKEINLKTASMLGTTIPELFGSRKLTIIISVNPMGALGSDVESSSGDIRLGEFEEFKVAYFNSKTYAHELIHWLTQQPGTELNKVFGKLESHLLFRETIADWISTLVTNQKKIGLSQMSGMNLPSCLTDVRASLKATDPASFFHYGYFLTKQQECCKKHLANFSPDSSLGNYCYTIEENSLVLENIIPNSPEWNSPVSPEACASGNCDPHQFSALLTPFLLEAQKLTPKKLLPEMLKNAQIFVDQPRKAFQNLRNTIPAANLPAFDQLWKQVAVNY